MAERPARTRHDAAWKQFFALPVVVEHLLQGFYPEVAALLDFDTLAERSGEWVHDGSRRRADAVWRVAYRDGSGRSLVVFLEFQSTVDATMARRVLGNVGMATERLRRNRDLDADGRMRPLCVVIHAGRWRWTAPGGADRVAVDADGEVLSLLALPYAALDARRWTREHLPKRNLVSTLFELNGVPATADVAAPLRGLGGWLDELGDRADPVRAAYAEWLATTMWAVFPPASAAALVARLTGTGTQEEGMTVTVLQERLERQFRRIGRENRRSGIEQGIEQGIERGIEQGIEQGIARGLAAERKLLLGLAMRKFGAGTAARLEPLLADIADAEGLERVGEWIIDCADGDGLIARFGNGAPPGA